MHVAEHHSQPTHVQMGLNVCRQMTAASRSDKLRRRRSQLRAMRQGECSLCV